MIYSISSNNASFKTVSFKPGFNVVLADKSNDGEKTGKNTRNGAGKTTLVEIIHFCLGSKVGKNSVFKAKELSGWSFSIEIDIANDKYRIERFTDKPNKMYIDGDISKLELETKYDKATRRHFVSSGTFNEGMRRLFFGLKECGKEESTPSFRELISYCIRRNTEGYGNAFEFFSKQQPSSVQTCNAFFLNLNLDYASHFQKIKEKKKGIENYKSAAKTGVLGNLNLNIGELSTKLINAQSDVDALKKQLDSFRIHPQYEEISKTTNSLTEEIHELANTLTIKQHLMQRYETGLLEEKDTVPVQEIKQIYSEAGVLFDTKVISSLEEVLDFHRKLVANRKEYLQSEIVSTKKEIEELKRRIEEKSDERSGLMRILESHGALEEYLLIQDKYSQACQTLADIKTQLENAEYIEESKSHLKIESQELLLQARKDYNERLQIREKAISLFKANTNWLYSETGTLTIDLNEMGYSYGVEIKNSRSQGVNYMKVFCYDMVLAEIGKARKAFPDFWIHDSTIFDGVDERQIARALMLADKKSEENGIQYICLMNSDMIPYGEFGSEFSSKFDKNVRLRISDKQEDGGLLGIRF